MNWLHLLSYFVGGIFLTNAIPHFVNGVTGQAFQSPFAKPPGRGLSSSASNVVWGFINGVVGYGLLFTVGRFEPGNTAHAVTFGLGLLLMGLFLARYFGEFHGGNRP